MKRLISILFPLAALLACMVPIAALAEPIQIGSTQEMFISVCFSKEDAMKVADATQKSQEAADTLFADNPKCGNVALDFKVGNVVHVVNIGNVRFVKVVEITDPTGKAGTLYWLTSLQIVKYKVSNET